VSLKEIGADTMLARIVAMVSEAIGRGQNRNHAGDLAWAREARPDFAWPIG
jgi:hypothetical protein